MKRGILYILLTISLLYGVFYIIYNATWLVGDDCACISHTGWGNLFTLSDYTIPETGRFYPLAFIVYNILPLFGFTSVVAHFHLLAIMMVIMVLSIVYISKKSISSLNISIWDYITIFAISLIAMVRPYQYFLTTEYSIWIDYLLIPIWAICTYFVHQNKSIGAAIGGVIAITYFCYCMETNAIIPLCYGMFAIFMWKKSSVIEKIYYMSMLVTGIIFFILYYFIIYLNIGDEIYDSSHGSNLSIIEILFRMFYAQKFYWIGLIVICVKIWKLYKNTENIEWWDALVLCGFAHYLGCVILHLQHTVYYWISALCMLPTILYYTSKWFGDKWTAIIFVLLALIMCRSFHQKIEMNQNNRNKSHELQEIFIKEIMSGKQVFYFAPEVQEKNNNFYKWREQKQGSLPVYIGNAINNHTYTFKVISEFEQLPGIYILPYENNELIPNINDEILNSGTIIFKGGYGNLTLVEIE